MGDLVVGSRSASGEPEGGPPAPPGSSEPEAEVPADGGGPLEQADSGGEAGRPQGAGEHKDEEKPPRSFWKELPILVVVALLLALLIKTFFVQAFSIPSDSMQNTLQRGDRVLVDKLTPWFGAKPERGEVVVFHDPGGWLGEQPEQSTNPIMKGVRTVFSFIGIMPSADEQDLIKRVIAVGGDTVECSGTGPVKVNGKALDEPYIIPGATPCADKPFGKVTIPKGHLWVMGDNRSNSLDSRYHQELAGHGTVPENQVVGRAFAIAWPINRWAALSVPGTFDQSFAQSGMAVAPTALGFAGAVPLVLVRRRRLLARTRASSDERQDP